jgi:hypothetical protein
MGKMSILMGEVSRGMHKVPISMGTQGIGQVPVIMGIVPQSVHLDIQINNPLELEKCPSLLAKYQVLIAMSKVFIGRGKVPIILFKVPTCMGNMPIIMGKVFLVWVKSQLGSPVVQCYWFISIGKVPITMGNAY